MFYLFVEYIYIYLPSDRTEVLPSFATFDLPFTPFSVVFANAFCLRFRFAFSRFDYEYLTI